MAGRAVIILSMLALTSHHVNSQFYDLFQGFQPFIQNLQTTRPDFNIYRQDLTHKRPKTDSYSKDVSSSSERRLSNISNDRNSKETSRTTTKSTRRRKITTLAPIFNLNIFTTPKPVKKNKNNSSHRNSDSNKVRNQAVVSNSNRRQFYDDSVNNVADYNTQINAVTTKPIYAITRTTTRPNYANTRPTTTRPYALTTQNYYNNRPDYNSYTTQNPLYNRPGVKPAVVDTNQPPITNRPGTTRPEFIRPTNTRPESPRPDYNRPYNTRPETPRPSNSNPRPTNVRPETGPATIRPNVKPTTKPFAVYPKPTDSSAIRYPEEPDTSPETIVGPDEDKMSNVEKRRYIELAERMCDKYKSLNVKKVEAIPLVPSPEPVQVNVSVCPPTKIPLVVGGKVVTIEEFPHMALLGWTKLQGGGYSWKCGGSLISDQYVLTAGHCAYQGKDDTVVLGAPRVVQLGSSYLDDTGALVMKVLSVVTHPKYVQTRSYYDVALVKMVKPVTFSQVVKPACLGVPPGVGEPIIATGWGKTEFGGTQSLELRSVSIPIWDLDECGRVLGTSRKLPNGPSRDSQICAGEKSGGKDTCQGDSGGPAQIQDGCIWRVVAVTSVGRSCGAPNTPALYATLHRAFIAAQVFGKTSSSSSTNQNNYNDRNENNNHNLQPVTGINNNWSNNKRRDENNSNGNTNNQNSWNSNQQSNSNSNGNTNHNQNSWNTNQQSNNNNKRNENSGIISNNQNWNNNNRRDENNSNGNTNTNQNTWNSNQQSNNNYKPNENSGIVNNNQNWNNNNQQTNNDRYNNGQNGYDNGYQNSNYQNRPSNNGYSVVTESPVYSGNNNRHQSNTGSQNNYNSQGNVNNDHKIVYPQENYYDNGNSNNNYGAITYTTHRPTYNNGWWSDFGY
ncbi:hypothetical protein ABMA28_012504 [Loxostege sticticalis]|uniref:Peptidase S1 domain-containing protein n=1 Tax=Loxostege sticticalis TaxID=481309 RepID=A0ABD0S521_LOXSC